MIAPTHAARRFSDDEPVALAKHAIVLLEQHLAQRYGVYWEGGAEVEFTARVRPGLDHARMRFGTRDSAAVKQHGTGASASKHPFHKDAWFPDSRYVTYGYREYGGYGPHAMLEAVLTHEPAGADGTPLPHHGMQLARNIEALRYQLRSPAPGYKNTPVQAPNPVQYHLTEATRQAQALWHTLLPTAGAPPAENPHRAGRWQAFHRTRLAEVAFGTFLPEHEAHEAMTLGLHINSSLKDIETGESVHPTREHTANLLHATQRMMHAGGYLLNPTDDNWQRWSHRTADAPFSRYQGERNAREVKVVDGAGGFYMENKLPPANCNPYYALMLQFMAFEVALREQHFQRTAEGYSLQSAPTGPVIPAASPAQQKQQFFDGALQGELNRLEDGLGDRFLAAIAHMPPGTEKTAMDKRHAEKGEHLR
ncbi:MAG: hypothetical protein DI582_03180 [Azospirillum brasilense]|nr:MAG: hypothetical protein DI582_03180 [Azospirillum brasilense]